MNYDIYYNPVTMNRKIYNVTDGTTVILCCYTVRYYTDNNFDEPYLKYFFKDYNGVLDFPHYKVLFNPFSVHDYEEVQVDESIGINMPKNQLSIQKIFTTVRKFLYETTKHENHIICYNGHKKYNNAIYLFFDLSICNLKKYNIPSCCLNDIIHTQNIDGKPIDTHVTNFVLDNISSFTVEYTPYHI
jgi:hypothetical protein